ncbi:ATP-binding cassette domain-containing protein [Cytobacillus purgationiresistens]|uniref:Sulfonate transport system ATP-binding protein n=1 Tax=Cytobacillus purgationiresistens TaxID=863449 RepID=A0ABU0AMJ9_9BACI|nr:ATP-binding cassette domain-containing protein [Cytobacillus purgationiresistens]MDQ0272485.1 sulfonate transport system ATP-binding protein [Cytobacillus purgationiresistens]
MGSNRVKNEQAIQIDIKSGSKSFGDKQVLQNISLTIERGQFVAIIGKSGSGKSTLLRLVADLETLTAGELLFNNVPSKESDANMTMMYQDSRLLPWKKVIDNVGLGLDGQWQGKAEKVLDSVGLLSFKDEWPSTLSGGQKQRVALARALIHEPSLLMLDEPLSALDAFTRLEMQNLIEEIWEGLGFTALLVTHDVREAIRLADRIILIEDGHIAVDIRVQAPRPRHFSEHNLALLEEQVLDRIMFGEKPEKLKKV